MKLKLIKLTEDYHHLIHWGVGIFVGLAAYYMIPGLSFGRVFISASLGALVPDLDHFLFMYLYGRRSDYATLARRYISNKEFRKFVDFARKNHKKNFSVYSHNLLTIFVLMGISFTLNTTEHFYITVFCLSCIFHYLFDIAEDVFYFGKLNPNWYLRFDKHPKNLREPL